MQKKCLKLFQFPAYFNRTGSTEKVFWLIFGAKFHLFLIIFDDKKHLKYDTLVQQGCQFQTFF